MGAELRSMPSPPPSCGSITDPAPHSTAPPTYKKLKPTMNNSVVMLRNKFSLKKSFTTPCPSRALHTFLIQLPTTSTSVLCSQGSRMSSTASLRCWNMGDSEVAHGTDQRFCSAVCSLTGLKANTIQTFSFKENLSNPKPLGPTPFSLVGKGNCQS